MQICLFRKEYIRTSLQPKEREREREREREKNTNFIYLFIFVKRSKYYKTVKSTSISIKLKEYILKKKNNSIIKTLHSIYSDKK